MCCCVGFQIWSTYEEPKEVEVVEEPAERKVNYSKVVVTEVTDHFTFYAQKVENGKDIWQLSSALSLAVLRMKMPPAHLYC